MVASSRVNSNVLPLKTLQHRKVARSPCAYVVSPARLHDPLRSAVAFKLRVGWALNDDHDVRKLLGVS